MSRKRRQETRNSTHQSSPSKIAKQSNGYDGCSSSSDENLNEQEDNDRISQKLLTENGIIELVELTNFMCHNLLTFKFGPSSNFVVGKNGSGKSAVMTAIVVGLGGTARCTQRGSNLSSFIKTGKQVAKIKITLRNRQPEAFKPDEYGSCITIQRSLHSDGHSTYRLSGEHGRVVSEKRDELLAILDQFNIQVDNPVCVLNQDASRNFLNSKNPKDKYKLFLKATQLDQIADDYDIAKSKREFAKKLIEQKNELLPVLQKEVNEWKKKYDYQQALNGLREKEKELVKLIAWAEFGNIEQELKADENKLAEFTEHARTLAEKVDKFKDGHSVAKERCDAIESELQSVLMDVDLKEKATSEKKAELDLKRQLQKNASLEYKKSTMTMNSAANDHRSLEKHIRELKSADLAKKESERMELLRKIEALEEKRADTEAKCVTTEHHCEQLKMCDSRFKANLAQIESEERRLGSEIDSKRRHLSRLESNQTNNLNRFGNYIPQLLQKVDRAFQQGRFRHKPIGPIGAHVKLHNARYSVSVEACIKPLLFAFLCDNHADERLLEQLFREVVGRNQRSPTFIVSKFANSMHDISRTKVHCDKHPCILDVLDIDNHIVTNALIDQRGVEGVLLIENNAEARHIMQRAVPKNCHEAFTATGDQLYPAPGFRYYSARSDHSGSSILQESVESIIVSLKESIRSLNEERQALKGKMTEVSLEKANNAREIQRGEQELIRMRQSIQRLHREINSLQNNVETQTTDLEAFEEELQVLTTKLECITGDVAKAKAAFERLQCEVKEHETALNQLESESRTYLCDVYEPLKESFTKSQSAFERLERELQHRNEKLRKSEEEVNIQADICKNKLEHLTNTDKKCRERFGERVTSKYPLEELKQKYKVMQKRFKLHAEAREDPIEVQSKFMEVSAKYQGIKDEISGIEEYLSILKKYMMERDISYRRRREYIAICVSQNFTNSLELRKFKGSLTFNHIKEVLDISVETSQNSDSEIQEQRNVLGLSGGERSFSTVSFMLALWQTVQSPFRMMDEFDIFMDMVTRRISMDMIMDFAEINTRSQFIILTPLDTTVFRASSTRRIFKMPDPIRGQSTLPFESTLREDAVGEDQQ